MHCKRDVPRQKNICSVCGKSTDTTFILEKEYCEDHFYEYIGDVLLSTTPTLEGYRIAEYLGVETATIVIGTGVIAEFTSDISDFFGARSSSFENMVLSGRQVALEKLQLAARQHGGNAIVGLAINFTEFSGNRIGVIAYGTLVRVEKE